MSDRAATMPSITSDSHFFDLPSSGSEDGLMATEQNFVAINSSSDALDGESKKCESDSDDEDKKKPPMRSKQPLPRRSESDGDIFPTKRPRSSPLTVNPSNSGVIGGRYVSKKKSDDDIMEEIGKLNDTTFWCIKEQERHNKVVEKKIYEECAMYKATALKENEERSLLQIKKKELFSQLKDLVKSGLSIDDIEALFPDTFPTIYFTKYDTFLN